MNKKLTFKCVANSYLMHTKKQQGITLIALVVTIIVLLILAGVAISILTGDNGIIKRAKEAQDSTNQARSLEEAKLELAAAYQSYLLNPNGAQSFDEYLVNYYSNMNWVNSATLTEENGEKVILIDTADGHEMKVRINSSGARIDESSYKEISYDATIIYNANGGEGENQTQSARLGREASLKNTTTFTKAGSAFAGWSLTPTGEAIEGNKITVGNAETTVYAVWAESYTVSFDANGAEGEMASYEVVKGNTTTLPANTFTHSTKYFAGWVEQSTSTPYEDKQTVTVNSDMVLVAQWSNEITITGESLLETVKNNNLIDDAVYNINVNGQTYRAHVYNKDSLTISSEQVYGTQDDIGTSSSQAQNMVIVKVNGDLTVTSTGSIRPFYSDYGGPKGFMIYVTGTLTNDGTIDNSHGAYATGQDVYLWKNSDQSLETVPGVSNGSSRSTGNGGQGREHEAGYCTSGGSGTSYSGGAGGAGNRYTTGTKNSGSSIGGAGGSALRGTQRNWWGRKPWRIIWKKFAESF